MYDYNAVIGYWHDGDTVILNADQGFGNSIRLHIRLNDVWCPELKDPGGPAAWAWANALLPPGSKCWIHTIKAPVDQPWKAIQSGQTFARWLGRVYLPNSYNSIGDALIASGLGTRDRPA